MCTNATSFAQEAFNSEMFDLIVTDLNSHTDNASSIDIFIEYHSLFGYDFNQEKHCSAWIKFIFNQADSIFQQDYWIDVNCVDKSSIVHEKDTYYLNGKILYQNILGEIDFSEEIKEKIINYVIRQRPNNSFRKYYWIDNKKFDLVVQAAAGYNANPIEIYIDKYSINKSKKYLNNKNSYTCNLIIQQEGEHSIDFQEAMIEVDCSHELITILKITSFYFDGSHNNETATKYFTLPDEVSNEVIGYICKNKK